MKVSMKGRLRGYIVFTSVIYRVIVYIAMPVGLVAIGIWGGICTGDMGLLFTVMFLPAVEVISDSWLFGGIQARDGEKMDYLRTSGRGMEIMGRALVSDLFRKFLTALCTIGLCYLAIRLTKGLAPEGLVASGGKLADFICRGGALRESGILLYLVLLSYAVSTVGTFVSRYGNMVWVNVMVAYGAMVLTAMGLWGIVRWNGRLAPLFVLDLLLGALGIGASILAVRVARKKVEGGYHDE